jgi:hypothetical protein
MKTFESLSWDKRVRVLKHIAELESLRRVESPLSERWDRLFAAQRILLFYVADGGLFNDMRRAYLKGMRDSIKKRQEEVYA